ncbi:hypothetical protein M0P48_01260 [Candidatus Gracilibacteria bacterium]|jgi:hypothetical protein|nr:hypothetical protein [Candidatus Gracilibacteria bacterium]
MSKAKIALYSLFHAIGVMAYIALLSWIFTFTFPDRHPFIGPLVMLTLFVVSATITGGLVLARPITLYVEKKKKEAVIFLVATILWLAVGVAVAILSMPTATAVL